GRRVQPPGADLSRQVVPGNVWNVTPAGIDLRDLAGVDVEAGDGESRTCELDRERQTHVAEADDADACAAGTDAVVQRGKGRWVHKVDNRSTERGVAATRSRSAS